MNPSVSFDRIAERYDQTRGGLTVGRSFDTEERSDDIGARNGWACSRGADPFIALTAR